LKELQGNEVLHKELQAKLKDIIAYQEQRLSGDSVDCLTDLEI
jgi:hypothetical protein